MYIRNSSQVPGTQIHVIKKQILRSKCSCSMPLKQSALGIHCPKLSYSEVYQKCSACFRIPIMVQTVWQSGLLDNDMIQTLETSRSIWKLFPQKLFRYFTHWHFSVLVTRDYSPLGNHSLAARMDKVLRLKPDALRFCAEFVNITQWFLKNSTRN